MTPKCNAECCLTSQLDQETLNLLKRCFSHELTTFISPSSSLTGGRQTPQNPGKVEKVCSLFLQRTLHYLMELIERNKIMPVLIYLHQCDGGWRFIRGAAVSLGTLWWRFGGSCRGRRTIFSSHPVCR